MKLKSLLAGAAACAIAVSAMAIPAFAEKTITNANADGSYKVDFAGDANKLNAYGLKATITLADGWEASGAGGGIIANADGCGWKQYEWGVSGEGVDCKNTAGVTISGSGPSFTITMNNGEKIFADSDTYTEGFVSTWWGADFTVDSIVLVDENGNEFGAAPAETTTTTEAAGETTTTTTTEAAAGGDGTTTTTSATTAKAASTTKAAATTKAGAATTAAATKAGDAGVGMAMAGLAAAGAAAMIFARKKH